MNTLIQPSNSIGFKIEDLFHLYTQIVNQQKAFGMAHAQGDTGVFRISGAELTDTAPSYSVSAGFVFYNEELFEVDAWSGNAVGAQVPVWELDEQDGAHEPHNLYVGNSQTGTHTLTKIRKLRPRLDASGTGIVNIADTKELPVVRLSEIIPLPKGAMFAYGLDFTLVASKFDSSGLGLEEFAGFAICNGNNDTIDMGGFFPVGYDAAETDYDAVGKSGGLKEVTLTAAQSGLPSHQHDYNFTDSETVNSGGGASVADADNTVTQQTSATGGTPAQEAHENRPPYKTVVWLMKVV